MSASPCYRGAMTRLVRLTAFVALLAPLVLVAGCKQGVGDRCQVTSDCQDGLVCVLQAGQTPQVGGTCSNPNTLVGDMAVPPDLTGTPPADLTGQTPPDLAPAGD